MDGAWERRELWTKFWLEGMEDLDINWTILKMALQKIGCGVEWTDLT
jgi:hypothetical protein